MDLPQPSRLPKRWSQKLNRTLLFLGVLMALCQLHLPAWGTTSPEPEPPSSEAERIDRALDEALNALATGMQSLAGLAEEGKRRWEQCRSGISKEEWCLKMKDALARLERLSRKESTPPPKSDSDAPPPSNPDAEKAPRNPTDPTPL